MVRALERERKKMLQYRLQYYMELLLQAVNGETEIKIKPLSASCSHQAVKRGGGSESSPPSRLDRSHGGCYESTAQVCARLLRRTSRVLKLLRRYICSSGFGIAQLPH